MMTRRTAESGRSWRSAMMSPPTVRMGAVIIIVRAISVTCWTCWTSFVFRVMSVAVPKWLMSAWLNDSTLRKIAERMSRPKPMATRALR